MKDVCKHLLEKCLNQPKMKNDFTLVNPNPLRQCFQV
jgi:hypothetical protein